MEAAVKLYRAGKYQEALEAFRGLKVPEDEYSELAYYLGLCYTKLAHYDEALLYLEQVLSSDLGFAQVYQARMILALIYTETRRYRLAEFELQRLVEDGFQSVQVHCALGFVLHAQGKSAAAIRQFETALEIDNMNPTALNNIAYIMTEENIRPGVALSYVRRALEQKPDYGVYLDTLGWVQFKAGNLEEAMQTLARARARMPESDEVREHIREVMDTMNARNNGRS